MMRERVSKSFTCVGIVYMREEGPFGQPALVLIRDHRGAPQQSLLIGCCSSSSFSTLQHKTVVDNTIWKN